MCEKNKRGVVSVRFTITFILVAIVNMILAYVITSVLGISNIILYKSLTASNTIITYEVIIWFALSLIEAYIYEHKKRDEA